MHEKSAEIKTAPHTVVFITEGAWPNWPAGDWQNLQAFIDDMDALGFAVWSTPAVVYIFTGKVKP